MPCSTSVTRMALKVTDCCGVGARPVSSRKAMSPRLKWPRISEGRSRPRTVILSGVLWPSSVCRDFLILLIAGLKVERDKRDGAVNLSPGRTRRSVIAKPFLWQKRMPGQAVFWHARRHTDGTRWHACRDKGAQPMDHESQAAIREAALDYFNRSDSIGRFRAWFEPPPGIAAGAASPGWAALAELGWPGMLAPESVGGLALGLTGAAEILCAAGTHVAPEPLLAVAGLSAVLLARLVSRHGSDVVGCAQPSERSARRIAQPIPSVLASDATPRCASMASADRQMIGDATLERPGARALLAELVAGRSLPALAWQESPGDLSAVPLNCGCEPRTGPEGGVLLQGEKLMVLPGAAASGWLVSARGDGDGDTVLLWVPRGTPGVSETLTTLVDGTQAAALRLEQVALPASALLAQGNAAQDALRQALACARILQSAELLGVGQAMLEQTLAHLRSRSQFGVPIGSFQGLQHRCVDMYIHLEVARATLAEVLALADAMLAETTLALERLEAQASRVNARCSAAALLISRSALQLHGAIGYTQECALSLFYKRTLRLSAWLGNASAHQRHYAALAAAAPTGTGPAPDDAAWEQGFPRTAD